MPRVLEMNETDFGSKRRAMEAMRKTRENRDPAFKKALRPYWNKVLRDAKALCPVGTPATTHRFPYIGGSLKRSIRIRNRPPAGSHFEVVRRPDDVHITKVIVAGGNVVNPNTGRIVDYARAVHDGTMKQSPKPFLSMALVKNEGALQMAIDKYFRDMLKDWGGS